MTESSPFPLYYEADADYGFSLCENGESVCFKSFEVMEHYVSTHYSCYELIKVGIDNWQYLYDQGAFDEVGVTAQADIGVTHE